MRVGVDSCGSIGETIARAATVSDNRDRRFHRATPVNY